MKKISLLLAMAVFVSGLATTGALAQTDEEQIATIKRIQDEVPAFQDQQNALQGRYETLKAEKLELKEMDKVLSEALKVHVEKLKEHLTDESDLRDEIELYQSEVKSLGDGNTDDDVVVDAPDAKTLNKWAEKLKEKERFLISRLNTLTSDGDALRVLQWELNEKKITWNNKKYAFEDEWSNFQKRKERARSQFVAACNGLMSKPKTKKTALKLGCGNLD